MDKNEYRILPIIQKGDSQHPVVPILVCLQCGAAVADQELHINWHHRMLFDHL